MIKERSKKEIILMIVAAILAAIILFSVIFYVRASRPYRQARSEAVALAEKHADLEETDQFYWFTREKTYFSLTGKNKKGQDIAVIIPQSGGKITLLSQDEGITEAEARAIINKAYPQESVKKTSLGLFKNEPVWEVVTQSSKGMNYYLVSFKDGEEVNKIANI